MPRKTTRPRTRLSAHGLTGDQIHHLLNGWILNTKNHGYYHLHGDIRFPFRDEDHRRELYFKHRDFLFSCAGAGHYVDGHWLFADLAEGELPRAYYDYEEKSKRG